MHRLGVEDISNIRAAIAEDYEDGRLKVPEGAKAMTLDWLEIERRKYELLYSEWWVAHEFDWAITVGTNVAEAEAFIERFITRLPSEPMKLHHALRTLHNASNANRRAVHALINGLKDKDSHIQSAVDLYKIHFLILQALIWVLENSDIESS